MQSMKRFASGGMILLLNCSDGGRFPLVLVSWFIFVFANFCVLGAGAVLAGNRLTRIPVNVQVEGQTAYVGENIRVALRFRFNQGTLPIIQ